MVGLLVGPDRFRVLKESILDTPTILVVIGGRMSWSGGVCISVAKVMEIIIGSPRGIVSTIAVYRLRPVALLAVVRRGRCPTLDPRIRGIVFKIPERCDLFNVPGIVACNTILGLRHTGVVVPAVPTRRRRQPSRVIRMALISHTVPGPPYATFILVGLTLWRASCTVPGGMAVQTTRLGRWSGRIAGLAYVSVGSVVPRGHVVAVAMSAVVGRMIPVKAVVHGNLLKHVIHAVSIYAHGIALDIVVPKTPVHVGYGPLVVHG
jgi:hypothetical protein